MRLAVWRREAGMTQTELANMLGCSQAYVSSMERPRDWAVPCPALVIELYVLSGGAVGPGDWYDLPDLAKIGADRKAA